MNSNNEGCGSIIIMTGFIASLIGIFVFFTGLETIHDVWTAFLHNTATGSSAQLSGNQPSPTLPKPTMTPTTDATPMERSPHDIGLEHVWDVDDGETAWSKIGECWWGTPSTGYENRHCVVSVMQEMGASAAAIEFSYRFNDGDAGYLGSFEEMGKVDRGIFEFPNNNDITSANVLLNGTPEIIFVFKRIIDEEHAGKIKIENGPRYDSLVAEFPNLMLDPESDFVTMQKTGRNGQRFIFKARLRDGCFACAFAGYAHIAFDFDSDGNFSGTELLYLEPIE